MKLDLTGINNQNEYFTNHYFSSAFSEDATEVIGRLREDSKSLEERTPWSLLRAASASFSRIHERFVRTRLDSQTLQDIRELSDIFLDALGYEEGNPVNVNLDEKLNIPVFLEITKGSGAPYLWVLLSADLEDKELDVLQGKVFDANRVLDSSGRAELKDSFTEIKNEDLSNRILFQQDEAPRFLIFIGINSIVLIDRDKWSEKRYIEFDLETIFGRRQDTTFQAMSVLLHRSCLSPSEGKPLIDTLDDNSKRNASGVSQDLKYALRECIERLGNEVIYYQTEVEQKPLEDYPIDPGELTLECVRYMYRMLFVLFIEARPELGFAPMKSQVYVSGYSLESLRQIAENVREDIEEVGDGYYLHETLSKLYDLIYNGYPYTEEELQQITGEDKSIYDVFSVPPLKAHIFDPERTKMIDRINIRNSTMLKILDLMSLTRGSGKKGSRGRISYSNLGINQLGSVYEALLSYNGFIAEEDLYEVKHAGDKLNELDVGYFVRADELDQYTEDERARYEHDENKGKLRVFPKGHFIYRLAGREREKSASYYTPEVLTKCLVKYALKELLKDKKADEILELTICEPAMGSASFLNEAINQLAEAYLDRKQKELGESISYENRAKELQKVKMYIADRNVYGIDLNPVAVELAEVSLWLNTIYEGGLVPWFGSQLVNGNSLIGARRQCYSIDQLTATGKELRWFENEPVRVPLGTERKGKTQNKGNRQVYHFLTGDPGMCNYTDKVIKSLEPENIKAINEWRKEFTKPYSMEELTQLLELSEIIDDLWESQVENRKELERLTRDQLTIYGHKDDCEDSHTSIRQKDEILKRLYKSEEQRNAGPYARLKFAMDFWCSLWFWPIQKANLLPTRSEFLFYMSLILDGTVRTTVAPRQKGKGAYQFSLFDNEKKDEEVRAIFNKVDKHGTVDIEELCERFEVLKLSREISKQNHFMHWELEYAEIFKEKRGFDFVVGNPPWIKMTWNEFGVLSEINPVFAVKQLNASETSSLRDTVLRTDVNRNLYISEYELMSGQQHYLNSSQNYKILSNQQTNLYKCFVPQGWSYCNESGITSYLHPDGVFDDPNGGVLREAIYPKLRYHFHFVNEKKLFQEVHHQVTFSINVYANKQTDNFLQISNLFSASTLDECFDGPKYAEVPGIKDAQGAWEIRGHEKRILNINKNTLKMFAKMFDGNDNWSQARLPVIHTKDFLDTLLLFAEQKKTIGKLNDQVASSEMWHEVNDQKKGIIRKNVHFPKSYEDAILSGSHIGVANPLYKTSRRECRLNSDFDSIDLETISSDYIQRCNYSLAKSNNSEKITKTPWGNNINEQYMVCSRKMLNLSSERTLRTAILPPKSSFINGIFGMAFRSGTGLIAGTMASLQYDFLLRITGKSNGRFDTFSSFPILDETSFSGAITIRSLLLNCVTQYYSELWFQEFQKEYQFNEWSKKDPRLTISFSSLENKWDEKKVLRNDFERRYALMEIDVLVALALGMTINQLINIYRIQFPVLKSYEDNTWYDQNGRIVFTNNRSLTNVGFTRSEWENGIKGAPAGKKFYRTITDDTMPGGPVDRTIEYVAPFDKCDRVEDYKTAWAFFEKKYGKAD